MKKFALLMMLFILGLCISSCREEEKSIPIDNTEEKELPKEDEQLIEKEPEKEKPNPMQTKIKWQGNIEDDFEEDKIIIMVDFFKEITKEVFEGIEIETITELTSSDENNDLPCSYFKVCELKLKEKGKQKVIDNLRKIEELKFVSRATPNMSVFKSEKMELEEKVKYKGCEEGYEVVGEYYNIEIDRNFENKIILPKDFIGLDIEEIMYGTWDEMTPHSLCISDITKTNKLKIKLRDYEKYDVEEIVKTLESMDFIKKVVPTKCSVQHNTLHLSLKEEYQDKELTIEDFPTISIDRIFNGCEYLGEDIVVIELKEKGINNLRNAIKAFEKYDCVESAKIGLELHLSCKVDEIKIVLKEEFKTMQLTKEDFKEIPLLRIEKEDETHYTLITKEVGCFYIEIYYEKFLVAYNFIESYDYEKHSVHLPCVYFG